MPAHSRPTVAFTSRYGSTARYARLLADRLDTTPVELSHSPAAAAGPLIVLAPIYASRPRARRRVLAALRTATGPVAVGLVGISPLDDDERLATAARLVAKVGDGATFRVFHLQGAYDPGRLGPVHRAMMAVARRRLRGSDEPSARAIRDGAAVDHVSAEALDPLVDWARSGGVTPR